jgi:2',3'-cyclic-nucleotide 2'-phosphodiesterase (5'-nucleotidase family)
MIADAPTTRKNRRRVLKGLAGVAVAAALPFGARRAVAATEHTLTFLHFNDCYQISPRRGLGGLAPLATLLKQERARSPGAITTFGGDLISPSLLSGITKGEHMIEFANMLGVQAAVLGNHEFDFGAEVMKLRVAGSKFPWLGANVLDADGKPFGGAVSTHIVTAGALKIGFMGLMTREARLYIRGGLPVTFADVLPVARAALAELQRQGAQVIVALTHMGIDEDRRLVRDLPGLHLVLGGHDHIPMTVLERGVLILKAGTDAEFLGVADLDVTIDDNRAASVVPSWRLVANHRIRADGEVQERVRHYEQRLDRELGQPIGTTETAMDSHAEIVRFGEAAIGNLVTDAMRAATGADVALMNGGGLRGNKNYPAGSTLTSRDIFSEMPFGNVVLVLEAKGRDLRAMLEHGLSRYGQEFGGFPQISGLKAEFDPKRRAGERVLSVAIGDAPLGADRVYRLATNDFLAAGGDGYAMLGDLPRVVDANAGPLVAGVVIDYIKQKGAVAAKPEGRLAAR